MDGRQKKRRSELPGLMRAMAPVFPPTRNLGRAYDRLARSVRAFRRIGTLRAYRSDKRRYVNSPDLAESPWGRDWAEIGSRLGLWPYKLAALASELGELA